MSFFPSCRLILIAITLAMFASVASAQFSPPTERFGVGGDPRSVAVGDFNGDGNSDLAVANYEDGTVTILLGNGSGGFSAAAGSPIGLPNIPGPIVVGDFNGDGIPDLAAALNVGGSIAVFR